MSLPFRAAGLFQFANVAAISNLQNKSQRRRRKERRKLAYAFLACYKNCKPRCKKDPAAKPSSAYQIFLGAARVHKRNGYVLEPGDMVLQTMKSVTKRFIVKHGYKSLVMKRAQPLTRKIIVSFFSLKEGTSLGSIKVKRTSRAWRSWRALNATAAQTGVRKDEVSCKTVAQGLTKVQYTRASLVFRIGGLDIADPEAAQLKGMSQVSGDGVFLKPRPSKADQQGAFWCDKPIFLPYREEVVDPVCAARELVQQELEYPVRGLVARESQALFCHDNKKPFSRAQVDRAFKAQIKLVTPPTEWGKYSFHSYRVWLACALDRAGCPPHKIKRILRWISDESLATYKERHRYIPPAG